MDDIIPQNDSSEIYMAVDTGTTALDSFLLITMNEYSNKRVRYLDLVSRNASTSIIRIRTTK